MATESLSVTNSQTITITLASLGNGSTNTSNAIDNSTNLFIDALVQLKVKTGATGVSATGYVNLWLIRSADGGTTYDDAGRVFLGSLPTVANATTYKGTFSTTSVGPLGTSWKVAVENRSGAGLDSTAGNHSCVFAGVKYTVA